MDVLGRVPTNRQIYRAYKVGYDLALYLAHESSPARFFGAKDICRQVVMPSYKLLQRMSLESS
jgi:hypothetical protein